MTALEAVSVHVTLLSDAGGSHVWVTAPVVSLVIVEPSVFMVNELLSA